MAISVIKDKVTYKDILKSREEYEFYIKITANIEKEIIALGGEYHADAEEILIEKHNCNSRKIWGGGYNINTKSFETNAMINLRPGTNDSMEIIDSEIRKRYIKLVQDRLKEIEK